MRQKDIDMQNERLQTETGTQRFRLIFKGGGTCVFHDSSNEEDVLESSDLISMGHFISGFILGRNTGG
jgi:hypothetical protein